MTCACLVLVGLATPLAAIALSICETLTAFGKPVLWPVAVALIGGAAALAMLGPGCISIDARLYGRKRIDLTQGGPTRPERGIG